MCYFVLKKSKVITVNRLAVKVSIITVNIDRTVKLFQGLGNVW